MEAAAAGRVEIVRMLLEKGANPNARLANGLSVLARASARPQNAEVVQMLKNAGAK
jgi:ankyrin repeat protein